MKEEILVAKKQGEKLKVKVCDREVNRWSPPHYQKVIAGRDFNLLAYLFYDLYRMGYNIDKAYARFKDFLKEEEPDLFFLK